MRAQLPGPGAGSQIPPACFTARKVVIDLIDKSGSEKHTASFDAGFGANNADAVEAFAYLPPGEYELDVYLATKYRSGFYNRGSRRKSPTEILLED
jgi:hypothetical protein